VTQITTPLGLALQPDEAGFDPIDVQRLRANVRATIAAAFKEELAAFSYVYWQTAKLRVVSRRWWKFEGGVISGSVLKFV
jgi:hypothetical protein